MNKIIFIIVAILLNSLSLQAGGTAVGDGGWGIRCKTSENSYSTKLLDFEEAKVEHNLSISLGSPKLSVEQKLAVIFDRMEQHRLFSESDIFVARTEARKFLHEAYDAWNTDLTGTKYRALKINPSYVDKSFLADIILKGCQLKAIAAQRTERSSYWIRDGVKFCPPGVSVCYVRDDVIWKEMSADQRAGLVIHEALRSVLKRPEEKYLREIVAELTMQ